jgi:hypothetical protein
MSAKSIVIRMMTRFMGLLRFFAYQYLLADKHIDLTRYTSLAFVENQAGECLKVNPFGGQSSGLGCAEAFGDVKFRTDCIF